MGAIGQPKAMGPADQGGEIRFESLQASALSQRIGVAHHRRDGGDVGFVVEVALAGPGNDAGGRHGRSAAPRFGDALLNAPCA